MQVILGVAMEMVHGSRRIGSLYLSAIAAGEFAFADLAVKAALLVRGSHAKYVFNQKCKWKFSEATFQNRAGNKISHTCICMVQIK